MIEIEIGSAPSSEIQILSAHRLIGVVFKVRADIMKEYGSVVLIRIDIPGCDQPDVAMNNKSVFQSVIIEICHQWSPRRRVKTAIPIPLVTISWR